MVRSLLVASLSLQALAVSVADHPVGRVISLLQELKQTAVNEGKTEAEAYKKYVYWCTNSQKDLNGAITKEKASIEELSDQIASHKEAIVSHDEKITSLTDDLADLDKEQAAANMDRSAGADLYGEVSSDLKNTIEAVEAAMTALNGAKDATKLLQAKQHVRNLLALIGYHASSEQRASLVAFSEPDTPLLAEGDRAAHVKVYKFKGGTVIELLKELKLKFEDELTAADSAETNAVNEHALSTQARDAVKDAKNKLLKQNEDDKTDRTEKLNAAESSLDSTKNDLESDSNELRNTEKSCRTKEAEWDERSKTRSLEIEAIETAVGILAKVTGVRTEAPGNPVPPVSPAASFLQLGASNPRAESALAILRTESTKIHSKALDRLVDDVTKRVKHGDGAFDQVINSIQKMIFHLMHEQKEEDEHKDWCDQELSKTDASITDKSEKVEELKLKIEGAATRASELREGVVEANEMVQRLVAHMQEATEIREVGKEENRLAVKDAEDAQTAVANAVAVLKDFYKSSGAIEKKPYEFLQGAAPVELSDEPSTWDSGYTGVGDAGAQPDGIVAVMEKIGEDFAKMEAETKAQEESDRESYQEDMKLSKIEQARRQSEADQKSAEEKRTLEKKRSLEAAKKSVAGELAATEQYHKDLGPACVDGGSTYEDRKAARAGEMGALKKAQDLLKNAFEEKSGEALLETSSRFLQKRSPSQGSLRTE